MRNLKLNDRIRFNADGLNGTGTIVGTSSVYIVELDKGLVGWPGHSPKVAIHGKLDANKQYWPVRPDEVTKLYT